jgi:uncharacterized protein YkwD
MKMRLLVAVSVLFVLLAGSCSSESVENANIPIYENAILVEQELLDIVNDHRNDLGYSSLLFSKIAYDYANSHTDYMIAKGSLSHDNFSSRASSISSEVNAEYVAENVAKDYPDAITAYEKWLESPNHRKTMEGEFTHTAVSVKKDSSGKFYFTQLFYR